MAIKPTTSTEWASDSEALAIQPSEAQREFGWSTSDNTVSGVPVKPNLQNQNAWQKNVHDWLDYIEETTDDNIAAISSNGQSIIDNAEVVDESLVVLGATMTRSWTTISSTNDALQWSIAFFSERLKLYINLSSSNNAQPCATSFNGANWTARTMPVGFWEGLAESDSVLVASGDNAIATSTDGISWTSRTPASAEGWGSAAYGNGKFVSVALYAQDDTYQIQHSTDGLTWTGANTPTANIEVFDIVWSEFYQLFIAVGRAFADNTNTWTSPDGITWTPYLRGVAADLTGVAVDEDTGLIVYTANDKIYRGSDLSEFIDTPWDDQGTSADMENIVWAANIRRFLAVGTQGVCLTSVDGIDWALVGPLNGNSQKSVCYAESRGLFSIACTSGSDRFTRSL
ncbi:MAG: hypothetical protein E2O82_03660 [Betaproteobacteria bacterium]|nr:MAG: hypothetical protein E2O82_03660 [Betaproteobacteria bacterium]